MKVRAAKSTILDISAFTCGNIARNIVLLAKGTFECTIHNDASELSKMADVDGVFMTVLLQTNLAIRTDFLFQGRIKERVLVANVATNFRILVASTEKLGALATVSGAISCPAIVGKQKAIVGKQKPIVGKQKAIVGHQKPVVGKQKPIVAQQKTIVHKQYARLIITYEGFVNLALLSEVGTMQLKGKIGTRGSARGFSSGFHLP